MECGATLTKTVYLANPCGFSAQQKATLLPTIVTALEELGLEVWEPFVRNNQVDFLEPGWAYLVVPKDFRDVGGFQRNLRLRQRRSP